MADDNDAADGACGPADASAKGIWGPWSPDITTASRAAIQLARDMATSLCGGTCAGATSCQYTEKEASFDGNEERTVNGRTEYRVQASSIGTCSCK